MTMTEGNFTLIYSISYPMENVADEQLHLQNFFGYVLPVCVERTRWSIQVLRATCAENQDVMKFDEEALFISISPVIGTVTPRTQ